MPWFVPLIMSLVSTAVGAGTSIINNNRQRRFQEQQLAKEQQLNDEINTNNRLAALNNKINENNRFSAEHASNLNRGTSTGLLANQMPAGTGIGVQGLNSADYLNEDTFMAKLGGSFSRKDNAKSTVRDNNNLYFDRIEYAKCGGRFARK